jgi:hypothetical protein
MIDHMSPAVNDIDSARAFYGVAPDAPAEIEDQRETE